MYTALPTEASGSVTTHSTQPPPTTVELFQLHYTTPRCNRTCAAHHQQEQPHPACWQQHHSNNKLGQGLDPDARPCLAETGTAGKSKPAVQLASVCGRQHPGQQGRPIRGKRCREGEKSTHATYNKLNTTLHNLSNTQL